MSNICSVNWAPRKSYGVSRWSPGEGLGSPVTNVSALCGTAVLPPHCLLLRNYLPPWILAAKCALQPLRNRWHRWRMASEARGRQWIWGWWGDSYRGVRHQRSPSISFPLLCRHLAHASANTLENERNPALTNTHAATYTQPQQPRCTLKASWRDSRPAASCLLCTTVERCVRLY